MFFLPATGSVLLSAVALFVATRAIAPSVLLVAFMGLRLVFLALFAAMFYCERRMSLRFPLLWEVGNLVVIVAKGVTFLVGGAPFREAWLLLGLCAASIALELVCVAHLHSSAGTLPRQHVFLHSAVGAMATMNLARKYSDISIPPATRDARGMTEGSALAGDSGDEVELGGTFEANVENNGGYIGSLRQNSFEERRRFLSDWNVKIDDLRVTWKSKVDELAGKLSAARRNRGWGGAEGGGGGGSGADGEGAPLLLLARMFAQEQAAIEELGDMWNRDAKWTEFFLPQYTLFLLYASFAHSPRLQELLLGRCESSVHTAHTIFWFLRAFCLQGARVTPVGVKAIEQMLQEVVSRGEQPARAFCELGWGGDGDTTRKYMELFDAPHEGRGEGGSRSLGGRFGESPAFVDELVKISVELAEMGKESRTEALRRRLREVQAQFLPSRAIYLPVGRRRHRVYRIAVEESFSFSTKDRAPYLVTLEVLDSRQQRLSPSFGARATPAAGGVEGVASVAAGDDSGAGGGRGGGGRLIRMLTPRALGQSLREIADNTLTTLKIGGSAKEGRRDDDGSGSSGAEDVESQPAVTVRPSDDFLSRGSMAAPTTSDSGGGGGDGEPGRYLLPGKSGDKSGDGEGGGSQGALDQDGNLTAATLSNSSGSAVAINAGSDINPPSPTESSGDPAGWPLVPPSRAPSSPAPAAPTGAAVGAAAVSGRGFDAETETGAKSESTDPVAAAAARDDDTLLGGERGEDMGTGRGLGERGDPDGGGGGSVVNGELGDRGGEADEGDGMVQRLLVPPSFSSTNLMGMWSRPSKRVPEVGQVGLFSPTSPRQFFNSNTSTISIDIEHAAASTVGSTLKLGPDGGDPEMSKEGRDGSGGGGGGDIAAGEPCLSPVRAVTPARSVGVSSATAAGGTPTMVAPSPGNFSAVSAGESVEALLLPRETATPGSAQRGGYGTTSAAEAAPATTPAATPSREEGTRTPSLSPRRTRKRRTSGYTELRSSSTRSSSKERGRWSAGAGRFSVGEDDDDDDDDDDEDQDGDGEAGSAPPKVIFKERWRQKEARLRRASLLGQAREWRLLPVIVKAGDDLRQEQLASQFFALAHRILKQSPLRARAGLRPYDIVATSHDAGIIEAIPDTVSIDALKKNDPHYTTLSNFFHRHFGPPDSEGFQRARRFFVESLAANSIVTYLLQVKDRHNGNILLDARGRVIHIDFGFMLANSPGGNFNFESAPFKLTAEFVDLMDGPNSACFKGFREVCVQTFMELRRKMPRLILLLETSSVGNAHLPCFGGRPEEVVGELRARFKPEAHDRAAMAHVHALIDRSMGCKRTFCYDLYQNYAVGIAM